MQVPFLDLRLQTQQLAKDLTPAMEKVISSCAFIGGPFVEAFEREFASFCGTQYAAGVSSGTDALWLALRSLEIGPGDEVITAANTFIATAEAISLCGATPVFVDMDPLTYTMDPEGLVSLITPHTRAIIPVHLYGQMVDMDPIMDIAAAHGLSVVEDACQAHGASYGGRAAGSVGDIGCFSFYPGKNLGAFGDAGAAVTSSKQLYQKIKSLRDHGQTQKYDHFQIGANARLDAIQAAVLREKLKHLDAWNQQRGQVARWYQESLAGTEGLQLPMEATHRYHVYHIYAIQALQRKELMAYLEEKDISCGIHYPTPIHLQKAYRHLGLTRGAYPNTESACQRLLSLPMYPELTRDQVDYVAGAIRSFLSKG